MNIVFLFKKTPIIFLLLLCFAISFNYAEAGRSIRLRKVKTHVSPRHISVSVRTGNGVYARRYAYGRPLPSYSTKAKIGRNRRYYSVRNAAGRRRSLSRNYASGYRNWTPNLNYPGVRNNPRIDKIGPKKKRRPFPFLKEPSSLKQKRRVRPNRLSAMQKPRPPKMPNEFDEDYFFPEEAKRAETKYEYESRYPRPKKKRRPEPEDTFKKLPDFSKIPFYDEKPYKTKTREPAAYSYSAFIQHPSAPLDDSEDIYEDPDSFYPQPALRNKKKRVKKKSNSRKKNKDRFKPIVFESDQTDETYPPYVTPDQYDLPSKSYKKRNKPGYQPDEDDFIPNTGPTYSNPKSTLFTTDSDYRDTQNTQQTAQFNPSYSQTWSNLVETTARPVQYQTENGFQPQTYIPKGYSYNKDYTNLQKVKTVTTDTQQSTYYAQPDNNYKNVAYNNYNYVNTKVTSTQSQTPNNYNSYYNSQPTYSQPVPSSSSTLTDITIQKSVPVYDNTETFYNFNNNAFVNSQSSKYYNGDTASKYYDQDNSYGARIPTNTAYRNKLGHEKTESDSEFIKKHQNLYNNGLAGIPVQGDGYAKESGKKDYDIGYGDFQFDENPTT